jgi:hypothetical protein
VLHTLVGGGRLLVQSSETECIRADFRLAVGSSATDFFFLCHFLPPNGMGLARIGRVTRSFCGNADAGCSGKPRTSGCCRAPGAT